MNIKYIFSSIIFTVWDPTDITKDHPRETGTRENYLSGCRMYKNINSFNGSLRINLTKFLGR